MIESAGLFFGAFCVGLAAPFRWGMRLIGLILILAAFATLLEPQTADPGLFDGLMRAVVKSLILTVLVGVAARGVIEVWSGTVVREGAGLAVADGVLLGLGGVTAGCAPFWMLAVWLQGASGGLWLHLSIATFATVTCFGFARRPWRWALFGAGLAIAALALDGGLRYPDLIASQAAARSQGNPHCLMLGQDLSPPRRRADLMALTLQKARAGRSALILLVKTAQGNALYRWSFRARRFVPLPGLVDLPLQHRCTPNALLNLPD